MISLFLDTSGFQIIFSVFENDKELYSKRLECERDTSIYLLQIVEEAFNKLSLKKSEVSKIFIVTGPGSFTGLRIGLSFAKTFAWGVEADIIEISSLETMASTSKKKYICPLIDARRGFVYAGMYDKNLDVIIPDSYIELSKFIRKVKKVADIEKIEFISNDEFKKLKVEKSNPNIYKIISKHFNDTPKDVHTIVPNYLKKSEAEEKLNHD